MADSTDTTVRSVSFSPDGEQVIATLGNTPNQASADNRAQIWLRSTGATVKRVGMPSIPWTGDLLPDGSAILVATGKAATLYRIADGVATRQVATVALEMSQAAFSPNGKYAATGGVETIGRTPIQVFATDTWARVALVDNGYNMGSLRFSADGSLIAASNSQGQVTVWRVADGRRVMSYKFDANGVSVPLAFSPDGKYFVAAACAKTCAAGDQTSDVRLWSTGDWSVAAAFKESNNPIEALGIPPGGDVLFMGGRSRGKFVRIQDALANVPTLSYRNVGLTGITCVDFSADGRFAAIGTSSSGVRLWGVP